MRMLINEAQDMVDQIHKFGDHKLTDWERNFLDSIDNSTFPDITEKMGACLEKIWDRIMK